LIGGKYGSIATYENALSDAVDDLDLSVDDPKIFGKENFSGPSANATYNGVSERVYIVTDQNDQSLKDNMLGTLFA